MNEQWLYGAEALDQSVTEAEAEVRTRPVSLSA
jgi:hypothetical protein